MKSHIKKFVGVSVLAANWIKKERKKIGNVGMAILFNRLYVAVYITFTTWLLLQNCGPLNSLGALICTSFLSSRAVIFLYDYCKIDWVGLEKFKNLNLSSENTEIPTNKILKTIMWLAKFGKVVLLCGFIFWDPAIAVIFYRKGSRRYNGIPDNQTALIFLTSVVGSSILGMTLVSGGIHLFHLLTH